MRREYVPVGKPAKRYSPAVSVRALRFNPVPWLTIVALTPGTAAPVGSVMMPETVASWVCGHALTEKSAANAAVSKQGRYDARLAPAGAPLQLFVTWGRPTIDSVSFFVMAHLNLVQTLYAKLSDRTTAMTFWSDNKSVLVVPKAFVNVLVLTGGSRAFPLNSASEHFDGPPQGHGDSWSPAVPLKNKDRSPLPGPQSR